MCIRDRDHAEQGVGERQVGPAPAGDLEGPDGFAEEALGAVQLVHEAVRDADHGGELEAPLGVGPAEPARRAAVDQGAFAEVHDQLGVLAAQHAVEGAQGEQCPLGVVTALEVVGVAGEPAGTGRPVVLDGLHALPHEVRGLEPHQSGARIGPRGLGGQRERRFLELVVVGERGGEPERGVDPQSVVEPRHVQRGAQVLDRGGR